MFRAFRDSLNKVGGGQIRNAGLRWAVIGGVVLGFLGTMKITGNLNKLFFAELIMMLPGGKQPEPEKAKYNPLPPGTEATIIIK